MIQKYGRISGGAFVCSLIFLPVYAAFARNMDYQLWAICKCKICDYTKSTGTSYLRL
jgi:hypothetical protein